MFLYFCLAVNVFTLIVSFCCYVDKLISLVEFVTIALLVEVCLLQIYVIRTRESKL